MTGGVAGLLKANGVEWVRGTGRFTSPTTIAVEGAEDVTFKSAIVATGSYPMRPPIPGLDSPRCVDSTGLLSQTEVPRRLVVLGGGIIGCEFASIFAHFGSEVTIVEMLPTLIPQEDADAAKELQKAFKRRGIAVHLEKQCTGVEDTGDGLVVRYGDGESVEADLMLVSVGRAPLVQGLGLDEIGVPTDPADGHRDRRPHAHRDPDDLRRRRRRGPLAARPHRLPRGRDRGRERDGARVGARHPGGAAPDLHRSRDRRRGPDRGAGARALRRRRRRRGLPVGRERPGGHVGCDRRAG